MLKQRLEFFNFNPPMTDKKSRISDLLAVTMFD